MTPQEQQKFIESLQKKTTNPLEGFSPTPSQPVEDYGAMLEQSQQDQRMQDEARNRATPDFGTGALLTRPAKNTSPQGAATDFMNFLNNPTAGMEAAESVTEPVIPELGAVEDVQVDPQKAKLQSVLSSLTTRSSSPKSTPTTSNYRDDILAQLKAAREENKAGLDEARMIENKFQILNKFRANVRRLGFGVSYTDDRAYLLWIPEDIVDEVATQAFRYNILEKMWTRWTKSATCGLVIGNNQPLLYIGDGVRPIIMQERKNLDRTDFADKNFTVSMGLDSFISNRYRLSDVSEIQVGDVIIQSQLVNTSEYHRLLQKLDLDTGLLFNSFYTGYFCNVGDNLASKLTDMNIKLVELDTSGTVTLQNFQNTNWTEMQQLYNVLIGQLNNIATVTAFKNYAQSVGSINFEHIISAVYLKSNEVETFDETEFVQGDLLIYKHIKSQCQTNPIHFGNPSSFKQINKGYLLFDQNNFFRMNLEYSTDLSPSFDGMIFRGRGLGFWGSLTWGFEDRNYWGGDGNDAPRRVILPRNKQRCRYVTVRFTHATARDMYRIVGVAHDVREFSARAYK